MSDLAPEGIFPPCNLFTFVVKEWVSFDLSKSQDHIIFLGRMNDRKLVVYVYKLCAYKPLSEAVSEILGKNSEYSVDLSSIPSLELAFLGSHNLNLEPNYGPGFHSIERLGGSDDFLITDGKSITKLSLAFETGLNQHKKILATELSYPSIHAEQLLTISASNSWPIVSTSSTYPYFVSINQREKSLF